MKIEIPNGLDPQIMEEAKRRARALEPKFLPVHELKRPVTQAEYDRELGFYKGTSLILGLKHGIPLKVKRQKIFRSVIFAIMNDHIQESVGNILGNDAAALKTYADRVKSISAIFGSNHETVRVGDHNKALILAALSAKHMSSGAKTPPTLKELYEKFSEQPVIKRLGLAINFFPFENLVRTKLSGIIPVISGERKKKESK